MRVKALCNIIYGGRLYRAGETFEAEKVFTNTIAVNAAKKSEESIPAVSPAETTKTEAATPAKSGRKKAAK